MKHHRLRRAANTVVLSAAALFGLLQSAQAAVYVGSWDPDFGGNLAGIGYRGTASFYVPNACLMSVQAGYSNDFVYSGSGCDAGDPMRLLQASVDLYDSLTSSTLDTLIFGPSAGSVVGAYIEKDLGGRIDVKGINSTLLGPQFSSHPSINHAFFLQFGNLDLPTRAENGGEAYYGGNDPLDGGHADNDIDDFAPESFKKIALYLGQGSCTASAPAACLPDTSATGVSNPATASFERVPEPGSLALVASALFAGWLVRRRRG